MQYFGTENVDRFGKSQPKLSALAGILFREITQAKRNDLSSEALPSATELTRTFWELGYLVGGDWCNLMQALLSHAPNSNEKLVEDILGMWNIVCRQSVRINADRSTYTFPMDWSRLPTLSMAAIFRLRKHSRFNDAFGYLMPKIPSDELGDLPVISIAIFRLLCDLNDNKTYDGLLENAQPLKSALAYLLNACKADLNQLGKDFSNKDGAILDYVRQGWATVWPKVTEVVESSVQSSGLPQSHLQAPEARPHRVITLFLHKRLRTALANSNTREVDELWADASKYPIDHFTRPNADQGEDQASRTVQTPGLMTINLANYFIFVYMALDKPEKAVRIWNHMVHHRLSPTLVTWASMMKGCRRARNVHALEGVWAKMVNTHIKPDIVCWSIRIQGLIELNELDLGLSALNEMGRRWLQEAQQNGKLDLKQLKILGDVNNVVKPTIGTVNAAIAAVLRKQKPDLTRQILAWAGKFGIEPDVTTYNTLLRPLIRAKEDQKAVQLLEKMQAQGFQADIATFTTILEETFRHVGQYTAEQQTKLVDSIFKQMQSMGIRPDLQVYGKIIYELLSNKSGKGEANMVAIRAVIDRMFVQGLRPTTYIHTILAEHFFDQNPPDLPAVEALIERAKLETGSVDHVFWDRICEGYARGGETNRAMKILHEQRRVDGKVSWLTLRTLLAALVNNEDWSNAEKLVQNARIEWGGPPDRDSHGPEGQHAFWDFATELRLF